MHRSEAKQQLVRLGLTWCHKTLARYFECKYSAHAAMIALGSCHGRNVLVIAGKCRHPSCQPPIRVFCDRMSFATYGVTGAIRVVDGSVMAGRNQVAASTEDK